MSNSSNEDIFSLHYEPASGELEAEVKKILADVVGEIPGIKILREAEVPGMTRVWRADIVVEWRGSEGEKAPEVIIYCKAIGEHVKSATYGTHMARDYMRLNDLRLHLDFVDFYLIVNRPRREGEYPKLDWREIFKSIGVSMINFGDVLEQEEFRSKIAERFEHFKR